METRTLQIWPGGASFEFRGDVHGPAEQRQLRKAHDRRARWRKGTPDEWRSIRVELLAEIYADRDVLACQSALVDDLIKADFDGFGVDDLENRYPNPDRMDVDDCRSWLSDHGVGVDCTCIAPEESPEDDCPEHGSGDDQLEALRDRIRRSDLEPAEVYEWWLVSSWLCGQLRAIGEVVIDNGSGHWWGRTCTGQGFIMDGTLQRIAGQFVD